MRLNRTKIVLGLLAAVSLAYGGLLLYGWQYFGASPTEVNGFLVYWTVGKGRLTPAPAPPPAPTRQGRWEQDLDYLATELPRLHANAFHRISREKWVGQVQRLRQNIPRLSDAALIVGVLELVAQIGDGHTNVHDWTYDKKLAAAPISLSWYGKRLYVTWAKEEGRSWLGAEVVEIGGLPTLQAVERAYQVAAGDSEWDKLRQARELLRYEAVQQFLGLKPNTFTLILPSGERQTYHPTPTVSQKGENWEQLSLPLLRKQHDDLPFWFEQIDNHTVYVRYLECTDAAGFGAMTAEIVPLLQQMPPEQRTLILDVRGNGGGDSRVIAPLQKALKQMRFGQGGGRAAVLTNRLTYSSAFANAQSFKKLLGAKIYGESAGENLDTYGEVRTITLPNSRLEVQISGRAFPNRVFPELGGGLLLPDVAVQNTLAEEMKGRDRVLETALTQPSPPTLPH